MSAQPHTDDIAEPRHPLLVVRDAQQLGADECAARIAELTEWRDGELALGRRYSAHRIGDSILLERRNLARYHEAIAECNRRLSLETQP